MAQTELSLWYHGAGSANAEEALVNQLVEEFNASQSDWKVAIETFPQGAYNDAVGAAALAVGGVVWGGPKLLPHVVRRSSRWWKPSRTLGEFARALAGFLQRGLALPQALGALEAAQLNLPTGTLTRVRERVEAGESLADALRDEPVFPASFVWVIGAAQRRGDLPETLRSLALRQEREHQRRVRRIEVLVAPLGLSFVGLLVGAVALSVFLPVFEMQKALQQ